MILSSLKGSLIEDKLILGGRSSAPHKRHFMITIIDLETTGLVKAKGADPFHQPHITEFYALKVDEKFNKIKEFETYIKPPIPIPKHIEKMIGITNQMVSDSPSFLEVFQDICNMFFKSHTMVAHNLPFDLGVIVCELTRIGKEHHFPYCPIQFCTCEQSMHIKGHRLKNGELYELATGQEIKGAHRAKNDVLATFESYKWLVNGGDNGL